MKYNKKDLYESIMYDVAKIVKRHLNESDNLVNTTIIGNYVKIIYTDKTEYQNYVFNSKLTPHKMTELLIPIANAIIYHDYDAFYKACDDAYIYDNQGEWCETGCEILFCYFDKYNNTAWQDFVDSESERIYLGEHETFYGGLANYL